MRRLLPFLAAALLAGTASAQTTGRVTTADPTYGNATTAPLSLQPDGDLRVAIPDPIAAVVTNAGTFAIQCTSGCAGTGGSSQADEATFTPTTTDITVMGCIEATDSIAAGSAGGVRCGTNRVLDVDIISAPTLTITDGAGALNVIVDSITAGANVIGKVGIDQTTPGTTNLVQITDGAGAVNTIVDSGTITTVTTVTTVGAVTAITNALPAGNNNIGDVDAILQAETTKVIGTVRVQGNVGGAFDAATGAAVPANAAVVGYRSDNGLAAGTAALTNPIVCQDSAVVAASTDNANTEIVALTASETIYICGIAVIADAAVTVQWIYGHGTACATSETDLSGGMTLAANGGFTSFAPFPIMKALTGEAFCVELTGTGNLNGWITYTKF